MNRFLLPLAALSLCTSMLVLQSCGDQPAGNNSNSSNDNGFDLSTPDGAAKSRIAHLKNNNISAVIKETLTPEQFKKASDAWDTTRKLEKSDVEKMAFKAQVEKITSGAFIDEMMPMIESQLKGYTTEQIAGMIPMLGMLLNNPDISLSEEQKAEANKLIAGLAEWIKTSDIVNPEKARSALTAIQKTVKKLGIASIDEIAAMDLEQALKKADIISAGLKEAFNVYGLNANDILDTITITKVSEKDNVATLKIGIKIFGAEFSSDTEVTKVNGIWVDAEGIETLEKAISGM